ncbi:MAG: hypothetical protein WAM99_14775, partial [Xanthobacteraceae bacterium]
YCTREENPCQLGAVHTWPFATLRSAQRYIGLWGQNEQRADIAAHSSDPSDPAVTERLITITLAEEY